MSASVNADEFAHAVMSRVHHLIPTGNSITATTFILREEARWIGEPLKVWQRVMNRTANGNGIYWMGEEARLALKDAICKVSVKATFQEAPGLPHGDSGYAMRSALLSALQHVSEPSKVKQIVGDALKANGKP